LDQQGICHPAMLLTANAIENLQKKMLVEICIDENDAISVLDKICNLKAWRDFVIL
jgi:hypothetical protein